MGDYSTQNLQIAIAKPTDGYQVIEFSGAMDKAGLTANKPAIENLVQSYSLNYLIFDMTRLDFINSESIGFLMSIHSHLVKSGKKLVVISAKPNVKDVFQVIGLFDVIPYFDSLKQFQDNGAKV